MSSFASSTLFQISRAMSTQEMPNDLAKIKNEVGRNEMLMRPQGTNPMAQQNIPDELLNAPSPTGTMPGDQFSNIPQQMPMSTQQMQQTPMSSIDSFSPEPPTRASFEMVEEIVESVVKEKWEDMIKSVGDIRSWKERMQVDTNATKQEILRIEERFDSLQKSIASKLTDYDHGVREVGTEMKALEQVLQKILGPLTRNIKELEKVVEEIKKKKR